MKLGRNLRRTILAAGALIGVASMAWAEGVSEKEIKGVDNRYAIASEHFGDGQVQVSTRSDTDGKNSYEIYSFSCVDETFEVLFSGDELGSAFPVQDHTHTGAEIDRQSEAAYIAAHTCEEHGYPLLGFEW